ncbi:ribosome-associated translation inhibitor RaiA [uncultured Polaribacter sp.]|uniref:ribosome hibernation-promoting factor, HPF/YfiA family n=1 Tax=uncultured Polaribacter sp. TaxID=174711 RepID=UPI002603125A|nr:ribosome-associated translation inhibitor RaiA [uncultured Polaribacter sp.]
MKTNIQFVNMPTSETMEAYTIKKLQRLFTIYNTIIAVNVFLKKEKDPKGNGKICEIEIRLSGSRLFASSNEKNYELAVKNTISDLEKQLKKRKGIVKPYL